jgi:RNA polymerase sigma factor (sigma-70 family)
MSVETAVSEARAIVADTPIQQQVSFETYVRREAGALTVFAYAITGNRDDALDAVQDALAGAYPKWHRIAGDRDPGSYIRRSIVNSQLNRWRSRRKLVALGDTDRASSAPEPGMLLAGQDWTVRTLAELPWRQRAAVALRILEDRDFADIARVCKCSEATARSLVSRGLARLRQLLSETNQRNLP